MMIYIKDKFVANDKKYRQVVPCGMLYSHCNRQYFLLNPYPLDEDWEVFERRFVVVPRSQVDQLEDAQVYPFARHIVTSSYTIEYAGDMPPIIIETPDDNNLAEIEHPIRDIGDYLREKAEILEER